MAKFPKPDSSGNIFCDAYEKDFHVIPPRNDDVGKMAKSKKILKRIAGLQ